MGEEFLLSRIQSGRYKQGAATLTYKKRPGRRGRWMLSLAYTDEQHHIEEVTPEVDDPSDIIVAGIDTGIRHAMWITYTDGNGKPLKRPDLIQWPKRLMRVLVALDHERKLVGLFNSAMLDLRSGRGRSRKLRPLAKIGDRHARLVAETIRQMGALALKAIMKRTRTAREAGTKVLVALEDHGEWSVQTMLDRTDRFSASKRKYIRRNFFRWHEGALRQQLQWVFKREGIQTVLVDPAWTSRTCHGCGLVHKRDWLDRKPPEDSEVPIGRVTYEHFNCDSKGTEPAFEWEGGSWGAWSGTWDERRGTWKRGSAWVRSKTIPSDRGGCGYKGHADHNAAINIARLGLETIRSQNAAKNSKAQAAK